MNTIFSQLFITDLLGSKLVRFGAIGMTDTDIKLILNNTSDRLGETITFYAASKAVSDYCQHHANPLLLKYVNTNKLWRTTYAAYQTAIFINIPALVDNRTDCSTFQFAANLLRQQKPEHSAGELLVDMESIRERYAKFRHKVFAHTDHGRADLADEFDSAGFTWDSIDADIKTLHFIQQVLWAIHLDQPIPTRTDALTKLTVAHLEALQISTDVEQMFQAIENGIL